MKQKGLKEIIILACALVVILALILIYNSKPLKKTNIQLNDKTTSSEKITVENKATDTDKSSHFSSGLYINSTSSTFKKIPTDESRATHMNKSGYFWDFYKIPYPKELTSIPENNFVKLKCSDNYEFESSNEPQSGEYVSTQFNGDTYMYTYLADKDVLNLINKIDTKMGIDKLSSFSLCFSEDGRTIIHFEIWGGGGGGGNKAFFSVNDLTKIIEIPHISAAYGNCPYILALTKDNILYVGCGGGDGASASEYIYQINLQSGVPELIYGCEVFENKIHCK